ncbi:MAG TPA: phosphatase PAP2 family protein [Mycobacteriales bacterium]|nr:phosphatase PAP2 family protein [Mycobacteriales bacterium]
MTITERRAPRAGQVSAPRAGQVNAPRASEERARTGPVAPVFKRPTWWVQVVIIVGFAWAYDEVRSLHGNVVAAGLHHGRAVLHLDKTLHVNWSEPMNHWLTHHDWMADILSGYYVVMHLGMTALTLLVLWLNGPRYRYHRNVLILLSLVGLGVYWIYPTAPPRLIGAGFHDTVAATLPFAYRVETASANLYAAVPSLHMAWALWVAIAIWSITSRWYVRVLAALHPVATAVTVLATGNHYTTDLLSGLALTCAGYLIYALGVRVLPPPRSDGTETLPAPRRTAGS